MSLRKTFSFYDILHSTYKEVKEQVGYSFPVTERKMVISEELFAL